MATKIGINGFGRIGTLTLRAINQSHKDDLEVAAINDLADTRTNARLLKWDTNYGRYPGRVEAGKDSIIVDGKGIKMLSERSPANIPWRDYDVDVLAWHDNELGYSCRLAGFAAYVAAKGL